MALPLTGVGGVAAPTPSGPIGRLIQRLLALRDLSPSPEVLRSAEAITHLQRAEEAARQGISGDLLDRVILYLESQGDHTHETQELASRVAQLMPAVADSEYC